VIFPRVKRFAGIFGHLRGSAGGAVNGVGSLIHEVHSSFQNRTDNAVQFHREFILF